MMHSAVTANYPYYYYIDWLAIAVQIFALLLFHRYNQSDSEVRRSCLPIGCGILMVTTILMLLQTVFLMAKDSSTDTAAFLVAQQRYQAERGYTKDQSQKMA